MIPAQPVPAIAGGDRIDAGLISFPLAPLDKKLLTEASRGAHDVALTPMHGGLISHRRILGKLPI